MSRSCGDCRFCCLVLAVEPLSKPAHQWCNHAGSAGCGIYSERPEPCVAFDCSWLTDDGSLFAEDERPDRIGVMFRGMLSEWEGEKEQWLTALPHPRGIKARGEKVLARLARVMPVALHDGGRETMLASPEVAAKSGMMRRLIAARHLERFRT